MQIATSKLLVILSLCIPVQTAVAGDDAKFTHTSDGVTVRLLAVSDGAGHVWHPSGSPLEPAIATWSSKVDPPKRPRGPHKNTCFLVEISTNDISQVSVDVSLPDAKLRSLKRANIDNDTPDGRHKTAYYQLRGVYPAAMSVASIEVLIGTGEWRDEGSVSASGNSLYSGAIADGGRNGDFLMQTPILGDAVKRIAVVALAMHDSEQVAEDYRIIAQDADGGIVAETASRNSSGFHMLMLLECPAKDGVADPVKYVFQQRPKNAVTFENIGLDPIND